MTSRLGVEAGGLGRLRPETRRAFGKALWGELHDPLPCLRLRDSAADQAETQPAAWPEQQTECAVPLMLRENSDSCACIQLQNLGNSSYK